MKYSLELEIEAPRSRVVELYDDPENWPKWQESFVRSELIMGADREVGSKTKLVHKIGRRDTEIIETIEAKNLPEEIICTYEAKGTWNRVVSRFTEVNPERTRWIFESEFRCGGILRIMSMLMPGMFRKASLKEMRSFKKMADGSSADT